MVGAARNRAWLGLALACAACGGRPQPAAPASKLVIATAAPEDEPDAPDAPDPQPARTAASDPLLGRWEGTGVQDDGQSWRMLVDVTSTREGRCGTVDYPSVPCSADWVCTGREPDGSLRAREELTSGLERCINGGSMTLHATPSGEIEWRWVGSGITARATLRRTVPVP